MRVAHVTTSLTCRGCAIAATIRNRVARPTSEMRKKRHHTTEDDIEYIREHYATMSIREIGEARGMSKTTIADIAKDLGLRKTREWIAERARLRSSDPNHGGRATRFQVGGVSPTKGRKIEEWMSPEGIVNSAKTRFQKGNKPANHRPVGSERLNVDGYIEVKIGEGMRWRHKQLVVWERMNGKVPDGHIVSFKDGNPQNCDISNLYLTTRAEQLRKNGVHSYPDDVREVIHMRAVLRRHINTQKRNTNGK